MHDLNQRWKHKFEIKPGRWVHVPSNNEIAFGTLLKKELYKLTKFPRYYWHLKDGGHVKALRVHTTSTAFAAIDLGGFFSSITRNRITRSLKVFYGYKKARDIAIRSTVWHPDTKQHVLPFGFVQSTLIASICLNQSKLGTVLDALNKTKGLTVSVYVDDIVISGSFNNNVKRALEHIKTAVAQSNFNLNINKVQNVNHYVDAFNIRVEQNNLQILDSRITRFRQAYCDTKSPEARRSILAYIGSVNPSQVKLILPSIQFQQLSNILI